MMYDSTGRKLVKEIKCPQTGVSLGTTMSISIENAVAVREIHRRQMPQSITMRKLTSGDYVLFIPFDNVSGVSIKDCMGREELHCNHTGDFWYRLPLNLTPGMKIVTAETNGTLHTAKVMIH
jgi:hypothetical protein